MITSTPKEDSKTQKVFYTLGILALILFIEGIIQCWRTVQIQQVEFDMQELKSRIEMLESFNGGIKVIFLLLTGCVNYHFAISRKFRENSK